VRKQLPPGKLLRGAHAVDREFMAMSALKTTAVPVPKTLLFVEDAEVLGTPFFVCEYVDGRFFKDPSMRAAGSPQERAALYGTFMRTVLSGSAAHSRLRCVCFDCVWAEGLRQVGRIHGAPDQGVDRTVPHRRDRTDGSDGAPHQMAARGATRER
jgi:hypothetical protein